MAVLDAPLGVFYLNEDGFRVQEDCKFTTICTYQFVCAPHAMGTQVSVKIIGFFVICVTRGQARSYCNTGNALALMGVGMAVNYARERCQKGHRAFLKQDRRVIPQALREPAQGVIRSGGWGAGG